MVFPCGSRTLRFSAAYTYAFMGMLDYTAIGSQTKRSDDQSTFLGRCSCEENCSARRSAHYGSLQTTTEGYTHATVRVGNLASRGLRMFDANGSGTPFKFWPAWF